MTIFARPSRAVLAASLLTLACDFGDADPLVSAADLPFGSTELAVSEDGSLVWTHASNVPPPAYAGVRAFDASTGAPVVSLGNWVGDWGTRELDKSWDPGFTDGAWVMHFNGYRTRWAPNGGLTGWQNPIDDAEFPADTRGYCLFATSADGSHFITTGETVAGVTTWWLYRYATDGTWSRTEASGSGCPRVTYDQPYDQIAVLDWQGYFTGNPVVRWFDPVTLALTLESELPDAPGQTNDFASFALNTAWTTGGTAIILVDPNGVETDRTTAAQMRTSMGVAFDMSSGYRLLWSGRDQDPAVYTAGFFDLVDHVP